MGWRADLVRNAKVGSVAKQGPAAYAEQGRRQAMRAMKMVIV